VGTKSLLFPFCSQLRDELAARLQFREGSHSIRGHIAEPIVFDKEFLRNSAETLVPDATKPTPRPAMFNKAKAKKI
jgi:hypothetical protein